MVKPDSKKFKEGTLLAGSGVNTDDVYGAVIPPLYMSVSYSFEELRKQRKTDYSRTWNPTRAMLGTTLANLENGYDGIITTAGMSALHLMFLLLNAGDTIIAPQEFYGATYRLLQAMEKKGHCKVHYFDLPDREQVRKAFECKPRMILLETPSNPFLRITDIEYVCELARDHGTIVGVDNTFLSPVLQKPLDLGADIVVHATTKYINGHGDIIGGAVIAREKDLFEQMAWWANATGITGSPYDSWLTLRGLRTLELRMERQQKNAASIAEYLKSRSDIENVYYPGFEEHENHDIARKQQKGFGAMLSFKIRGDENVIRTFFNNLELFSLTVSLGGFESLICHPASMTHVYMDPPARKRAGITENLIRLSAGIEDADDLIADLKNALDFAIQKAA